MTEERATPIAGRWSTARRLALALLAVMALAAAGLWLARKPIASDVIDRALRDRGVAASYRIADLGLGRQRLVDVVIGDPRHPDLVADWVELGTRIGLDGAQVTAVRAGQVRARAAIVDGRLSFGSIDRLLPAPSGKPFALPAIDLDVADARVRLVTPLGVAGLRLAGRGRLDGGFRGTLAAVSEVLAGNGCRAGRVATALAVSIADARPTLRGPMRMAALACARTVVARPRADVEVTLGETLDRWDGSATVAADRVRRPEGKVADLSGNLTFVGTRTATRGSVALASGAATTAQGRAAALTVAGSYAIGGPDARFDGSAKARHLAVALAVLQPAASILTAMAGSPLAPLGDRFADAIRTALSDADANAAFSYAGARLTIGDAMLASASGARIRLAGRPAMTVGTGITVLNGTLALGGGGLPEAVVAMRRNGAGMVTARATVAPYAAADARLTLSPVALAKAAGGAWRVTTTATLTGPLPGGRVENLLVPIDVRGDAGRIVVDPTCVPVALARLRLSGLALGTTRMTLCPIDGGLVTLARGHIGGGATSGALRLAGRIGSSPLALEASGTSLRLATRSFAVKGLRTAIGAPDRSTRIDVASLTGRIADGEIAGSFGAGGGRIGNVPLVLSDAAGDWRFARGRLTVGGALTVSDAAATARFKPLAAHDVVLTLDGNLVGATGTLFPPGRAAKVADVAILHDLGTGTGRADLTVPALSFTRAFQPDALTPLTFGVIADVAGTITGAGHIAWTPDGVTSTGHFSTAGTDLAAAFGPVTGIAGSIDFTDLLNLESAPGQDVTIASVNPGIPVGDGVVRFQTLPGSRVRIESGRWPFAGGTLTLEPTLLDFSAARERRMTFDVAGVDAQQFLAQFDFKNIDASGTFDGALPMVFDAAGGRIAGGHLAVRGGGGTIAYVGDLSEKDLGFWPNIAFQALKSLKYRSLTIDMNGPLTGEMVTQVRFAGVSQGEGATSNFLVRRLQRLPFVFNVTIRAPFRGLLDTAQSFYDPKRLIERNLPALLQEQDKQGQPPVPPSAVQPAASGIVPPPKQD